MKFKTIVFVTLFALGLAACSQPKTPPVDVVEELVAQEETVETEEESTPVGYELETQSYGMADRNISIQFPVMKGFRGELLQDYVNQSLSKITDLYGTNEMFGDVEISYEVTRMDDEVLSVVYRGTALMDGGREIKILKSMNLDVGDSCNEIGYTNFVANNEEVRKIIGERAIELGLVELFEAEGIMLFFQEDSVVFYYMPLDDTADTCIEVPVELEQINDFINLDFGEMPAS